MSNPYCKILDDYRELILIFHLEQMENLLIFGVPILRHITVLKFVNFVSVNMGDID